jgi:hypothetical protein
MTDDRATEQSISAFLSEPGGSPSVRSVSDDADRPARKRQLRVTFRTAPSAGDPGSDPGFPGTRTFAPHRPDRREAGGTVAGAGIRIDEAPADRESPDDLARRDSAILETGPAAAAVGASEPAAARAGGRGVRGRGSEGARTTVGSADRRGASGARGRPKKEKSTQASIPLPAAIKKLVPKTEPTTPPASTRIAPTESERADARRLFREIGQRFNLNRKKSKTAAYAAFRHDLMDNLDTLIMGGALDLKEATTIITNLEQYTRETEQESTETPATILGRWLRMEPGEVVGLEPAAVEEVVEEESGEEIDELEPLPDPADNGNSEAVT